MNRPRPMTVRAGVALVTLAVLLGTSGTAPASNASLSGNEGHPRERFPLSVHVAGFGEPAMDATARRAVEDWNRLSEGALGVRVFSLAERPADAQVVVVVEPRTSERLMGMTYLSIDDGGLIGLPVKISVNEPTARGLTTSEVVLYQVLAHELGHALGLTHVREPRSLMCCVSGSIDFNDPVQRDAYVEARRHPDLATVRTQLADHYARFWRLR